MVIRPRQEMVGSELGARHCVALADAEASSLLAYWERRLPAGRPKRASASPTAGAVAETTGRRAVKRAPALPASTHMRAKIWRTPGHICHATTAVGFKPRYSVPAPRPCRPFKVRPLP